MAELLYCVRFKGQAEPEPEGSGRFRIKAAGESCHIQTTIDEEGVRGALQPVTGGFAEFESRVRMKDNDTFEEEGEIQFGEEGPSIRFVTFTPGKIEQGPEPNETRGAITYRVEGGKGQLKHASGLITANFRLGSAGEVENFQLGLLHIPEP
jgi:hypothetical protein